MDPIRAESNLAYHGLIQDHQVQYTTELCLAGRLESIIKDDPVPTTQEGPVTNVVAHSYEEIILNNEKDVLVL